MTDATDFRTLTEIVRAARRRLPDEDWDYLAGAAGTETTMLRNRQALDALAFRPRVLNDVREVDPSTSWLGRRLRLPVVTAPMGSLDQLDPGGHTPIAEAAAEFGIVSILSSVTFPGIEAVRRAVPDAPMVYQLYVRGDLDWTLAELKKAADLGFVALCLTVDTARYSRRERDIHRRFVPRARVAATGMEHQAGMTWDLVKRVKDRFDLPLVLKGIATAEDAALSVEHGVEVVYVSNHGGRQLDHGRGAIEVLPEVVRAVDGRASVAIDGGFIRGTDILKAIALGADVVGLGKMTGWALAAGGAAGVLRMLEILETEMTESLGLLGLATLDGLGPEHLAEARPVTRSEEFSAFAGFDPAAR